MNTDYDALCDRLLAAPCPEKLFPARLRALEIHTGEQVFRQIEDVIRRPLAALAPPGAHQFERDLDTYGLLEAIVYFHSYPPLDPEFVEAACRLYERLATLYTTHHRAITQSDDPRIAAQLHLLAFIGGHTQRHIVKGLQRVPRPALGGISPPAQPVEDPNYRRTLPVHPDLHAMLGYLGGVDTVVNRADELLEHICATFMFDGHPSVQVAFFDVADILDAHRIDVFGAEGQYVLSALCSSFNDEMFGDFDQWLPCGTCDKDFLVTVALERVNATLTRGFWQCEVCKDFGS